MWVEDHELFGLVCFVGLCCCSRKTAHEPALLAVIKRPQPRSEHARQDRRESERVPPKSARPLLEHF